MAAPDVAPVEDRIGISTFLTDTPGTGGKLRTVPEDFVVEEVPNDPPPADGTGKYTIARVRARNWETNRLVRYLATQVGVHREAIYFTGTKDKRAVTTQHLAIKAPQDAVEAVDLEGVEVLETYRANRAPKLGELRGNRFRIRLRDLDPEPGEALADARATMGTLAEVGVPNFFGVQRFGSRRPITHIVGQRIVEGDLMGAVTAYVGRPEPGEPEVTREARARFEEEQDPQEALSYYPGHLRNERMLLERLAERPDDPAHALRGFPRNLLRMFVYAYQSLLFNRMVSRRIGEGLDIREPLAGDLVLPADKDGIPDASRFIPVTDRNRSRVARMCRRDRAFPSGVLYGYDVELAEGTMGTIERDVVAEEGVDADAFRSYALPEADAAGTRRALRVPLSDVDVDGGEDAHGAFVELEFFLPKGAYATCVLREVMKSGNVLDY